MRKEKAITVDGEEIIARELEVEEVANVMDGLVGKTIEKCEMFFPDRIPAAAVRRSTGLTEERMNKMTPSQLDAIWKAAEEANPFFVELAARTLTVAPQAGQQPATK